MNSVKNLPIYQITYRNALAEFGDEALADKLAQIAVSVYFTKRQVSRVGFYITKASIVDEKMVISATASNTSLDAYEERMSVSLYETFIRRFSGKEYISLSHYPDADGYTSLGLVQKLFIDGDKLKMRAEFNDTPLGIAAFNSIRKDRRDNIPHDERIRISIGFYDFGHEHGPDKVWRLDDGVACPYCKLGVKNKTYIDGILEHAALTRRPAVPDADIDDVEENDGN